MYIHVGDVEVTCNVHIWLNLVSFPVQKVQRLNNHGLNFRVFFAAACYSTSVPSKGEFLPQTPVPQLAPSYGTPREFS